MALDYVTLSANILSKYVEQKDQRRSDNVKQISYPYLDNPTSGTVWMDNYVDDYDTDANNGVFSAASVVMISQPELLRFNNYAVACGGDDMMAAKISEYWMAQVTFGSPQMDGIISITNDAAKIRAPIENYMCSYPGGQESTPYYEHLFKFIEQQVKTIIWTVTELSGGVPTSYTVTIS